MILIKLEEVQGFLQMESQEIIKLRLIKIGLQMDLKEFLQWQPAPGKQLPP